MHSGSTSFLFLLLPISSLLTFIAAQTGSETEFGECVNSCLTTFPIVSHCNGTETGAALDECTCASFTPTNDPLIGCVQTCPSDQQLQYAQSLPELCAQTLFLGLPLSDDSKPTAVNTAASASTGLPSSSASASASGSGNGAVALCAGANVFGYLALVLGGAAML